MACALAASVLVGGGDASAGPAGRAASTAQGGVSVLFAGSLVRYMESDFGPAFERATGYGYTGYGGGSTRTGQRDQGQSPPRRRVRERRRRRPTDCSRGPASGAWVSWYSTFAATPLMLAYNPHSRFGAQLAHGRPWYQVLTEPGVLVGRTDPKLDPKGVLTAEAVKSAAAKLHEPALGRALESFPVYPETALVGRLQSGQLDAGFFYKVEASTAQLPTVSLAPVYKYAEYTVTILAGAPNPRGATALVRYLLARARSFTLEKNGLNPVKPRFFGSASAVPASLRSVVGAR